MSELLTCFNSMKVRLKLGNVLLHADALPVFQFHEGPIKTLCKKGLVKYSVTFQFHEGPIKTDTFLGVVPTSQLFPFHEGPIKTKK